MEGGAGAWPPLFPGRGWVVTPACGRRVREWLPGEEAPTVTNAFALNLFATNMFVTVKW